jgi:hypothetical protein
MKTSPLLAVSLLAAAVAALSVPSAMAADVETVVAIRCDGEPVAQIRTVYAGVSAPVDAKLQKRAMPALDVASKAQDKGGPCVMTWQWGTQPIIETTGMSRQAVSQTMQRMSQYMREATEQAMGGRKGAQWGQ